jgi:putative endonuclease
MTSTGARGDRASGAQARDPGHASGNAAAAVAGDGDAPAAVAEAGWWLYLLQCGDGSWYAGITNDLDARMRAHADGRGARYTRGRGPLKLLAARDYPDRAAASRAEWQLKRLPKRSKLAFFGAGSA